LNACKKLQAVKQIFEKNDLFRALFPEILPTAKERWSSNCLTVRRNNAHPEGTFEAAGTGTAVTSRHYDLIIEDDTVAPEKDALSGVMQQPTQLEIEKAIGWHRLAMPLQLHPTKSQRVVVGTRWAERDLIAWVLQNEPQYVPITRKARENGKVVWDRFDEKALEQIEKALGPYMFGALYMNEPTSAINQTFRREWIHYFEGLGDEDKRYMVNCTSVDPAPSDTEGSSDPDYNIVLTTGINPRTGNIYVRHYTRARMNPGELIAAILEHQGLYKPVVVKIEAIAYQRTIGYWLKRRRETLNRRFYVEEVKTYGNRSKVDRIRALQPYFADGLIFIRSHMGDLERELLSFPRGAHDDILDALAMQVPFWENETEMRRMETENEETRDIFSGAAIIDELLERSNRKNMYPFDIGLMGERKSGSQLREYAYV
jgi:predicted phage terminase large subunit-like protein